jgi:hypothetical protein
VAERLNVASWWRWVVLLAVLLCLIAVAHPMTAHAARLTPTVAHSVTANTSRAILYPECPHCGQMSVAVRATSIHPRGRASARERTRSGGAQTQRSQEGG